jgi:alpha-beta hydrolase superfamily lysophospholipase
MKILLYIFSGIIISTIIILTIMIAIEPPQSIPKLESIADPFYHVDFSRIPDLKYYAARNGSRLAYREYSNLHPKKTVVLVHGSSGSSISMHPLAQYLNKQGMAVYALDIRGHGNSGKKGDIDYIGQLENDLEDFVNQVLKEKDATLAGFSAGGGFVLRFAAGGKQKLFSRYVLLSPYMGYNSPTVKPDNGGWAAVSTPRIIGILLLGDIGEKILGHLPVITYAIDPQTAGYQTAQYSFRLLRNFGPHFDYRSDIISVKQPLTVIVGGKDELFNARAFQPLFTQAKAGTKVIVVTDAGHITLTTSVSGITAVAKAIAED